MASSTIVYSKSAQTVQLSSAVAAMETVQVLLNPY